MIGGYRVDAVGVLVLSEQVSGVVTEAELAVTGLTAAVDECAAGVASLADVATALSAVTAPRDGLGESCVAAARSSLEVFHAGVLAIVEGDEAMSDQTSAAFAGAAGSTPLGSGSAFDAARFGQVAR